MCANSKITTAQTTQQLVNSTPNMQCATHLSVLIVSPVGNIELQYQCRSNISSTFSVMIKILPESWPPHVGLHFRAIRNQNLEHVRRAHREDWNVGAEDWPVQNFKLKKYSAVVNCQILKTVFKRRHHPMKATRRISTVEPSLIEPTNVTNCLKQVPQ